MKKSNAYYSRRKLMEHINTNTEFEVDMYNLQAIEILERAGFEEPSEIQINTIEQILRAA